MFCSGTFFFAVNLDDAARAKQDKVNTVCVDAVAMYNSGFSDGQANLPWKYYVEKGVVAIFMAALWPLILLLVITGALGRWLTEVSRKANAKP